MELNTKVFDKHTASIFSLMAGAVTEKYVDDSGLQEIYG
jgi:hypothetical protein